MRALLALTAIGVSGICLYALPGIVELALLHARLNPWISCVVLGDLLGCSALFLLGFRKMAAAIYVSSSLLESSLLYLGIVPAQSLIWITNLVPALALGLIFVKAALRNLVLEES